MVNLKLSVNACFAFKSQSISVTSNVIKMKASKSFEVSKASFHLYHLTWSNYSTHSDVIFGKEHSDDYRSEFWRGWTSSHKSESRKSILNLLGKLLSRQLTWRQRHRAKALILHKSYLSSTRNNRRKRSPVPGKWKSPPVCGWWCHRAAIKLVKIEKLWSKCGAYRSPSFAHERRWKLLNGGRRAVLPSRPPSWMSMVRCLRRRRWFRYILQRFKNNVVKNRFFVSNFDVSHLGNVLGGREHLWHLETLRRPIVSHFSLDNRRRVCMVACVDDEEQADL